MLTDRVQAARLPRRGPLIRELGVVALAYFVYFRVRGMTEGDWASALRNAKEIEGLERSLGIFVEPTLQAAILGHPWIVDLLNFIYLWGHWPVIGLAALWLYRTRPASYRLYRNAFLVSGAIGLCLFVVYPVAPPRLVGVEFVDTVAQRADVFRLLQPKELTNQYAAFPSLHFGWNLLVGIAVIEGTRRWTVRALGLLSPLAMLAAIVLTANHYLLDAVGGAIVALIGLIVAHALASWQLRPVPELRVAAVGGLGAQHSPDSRPHEQQTRAHVLFRRAEIEGRAGSLL